MLSSAVGGPGQLFVCSALAPRHGADSAGKKLCSLAAELINVQIKKDVRALK